MRHLMTFFLLYLSLLLINGCNRKQSGHSTNIHTDTLNKSLTDLKEFQIWQLDYYPDSILINRSINDNSGWGSAYAYNIIFSEDSCQFIGWHESWRKKMQRINETSYRTSNEVQYWEFKFISVNKMIMREIFVRKTKIDIGAFYQYHRVSKILTQDSLQNMIAKNMFTGKYKLLFSDILNFSDTIIFEDNFKVTGIKDVDKYDIETEIDLDFPVKNAFGFRKENEEINRNLSFEFLGDTLFLKDIRIVRNDGDFDHVAVTDTRVKMIKIKE